MDSQKYPRSRSPARSQQSSNNLGSSRVGSSAGFPQADSKDIYISQLVREIKDLKLNDHDYRNIAGTVANLEKRLAQLKADKAQTESNNQRKHEDLVERLAGIRTKIDEYKSRTGEKENECKNISADIEASQRALTSKKQNIEQLTFEVDDLINKKSQLENDLVSLKSLHSRVSTEREEYFTSVQLGSNRIDELAVYKKNIEAEIDDLEARIDGKRKSLEKLNNDLGEIERETESYREEINNKDLDISETDKGIISLTSKIDMERRSRDVEKDELDMLNAELARLMNTTNELQLSLQKTNGKLRNKEKKLEEKKHETYMLESKSESLKAKNEEIEETIETTRSNIEKVIAQCKEVGPADRSKSESSRKSPRAMRRSDRGSTGGGESKT